jgi:hypothetical protein
VETFYTKMTQVHATKRKFSLSSTRILSQGTVQRQLFKNE